MGALLSEKRADVVEGTRVVRNRGNDFDAIAGGKDDPFVNGWETAKPAERIVQIWRFERDAFPHIDGRGSVIQAYDDNIFRHQLIRTGPHARRQRPYPPIKSR